MSDPSSKGITLTAEEMAQFLSDCRTLLAHSRTFYEVRDALAKAVAVIQGMQPVETNEPPEPTPEMIMQGVWAWQRGERHSTAEDVRAIYIAMRRMEGRSAEETSAPLCGASHAFTPKEGER